MATVHDKSTISTPGSNDYTSAKKDPQYKIQSTPLKVVHKWSPFADHFILCYNIWELQWMKRSPMFSWSMCMSCVEVRRKHSEKMEDLQLNSCTWPPRKSDNPPKTTLHLGQTPQAQVFQLKAPVPLIIASLSLHTDRKGVLNGSWLLRSICGIKPLTKQAFTRGRATYTYRICLIQMYTASVFFTQSQSGFMNIPHHSTASILNKMSNQQMIVMFQTFPRGLAEVGKPEMGPYTTPICVKNRVIIDSSSW